jgi:hypothetical protein
MEVLYFLTKELLIESVEPNIILLEMVMVMVKVKDIEKIDPDNLEADEAADEVVEEVVLEDHEKITEDNEKITEDNEDNEMTLEVIATTSEDHEVMNHEDHSILNNNK